MSNLMKEQTARDWLQEHAPYITIIKWGGGAQNKSIFYNIDADNEFEGTLSGIKNNINNGFVVGKFVTSFEGAVVWLEKNAPYLKIEKWSKKSTFINTDTGYRFKSDFSSVKSRIKQGGYVGGVVSPNVLVTSNDLAKNIEAWLKNNAPHIELLQCADKPSELSLFKHLHSNNEFYKSFSHVKRDIKKGINVGFGAAASNRTQWSHRIANNDVYAREWLAQYTPHITLTKWGGKVQSKSEFYSEQYGGHFIATLNDIKNIYARGVVPYIKRSTLEIKIEDWLKSNKIEFTNNKQIEGTTYRPDFFLPEYNIIIECDGLYYHSDAKLSNKYYHQEKQKDYSELGYRSFFFREDEIHNKFDIVTSIISNALGLNTERVFARKCTIENIDPSFFEQNHLMGKGKGKSFGLIHKGEIVAGIQVKWTRKSTKELEISRFCVLPNTSTIGGFSKLLKHVECTLAPSEIKTFVDLRYGTGSYLEDLGFIHKNTDVSFKWTIGRLSFHRRKYDDIDGYDKGLHKIWDCGQAKYIKII